ncbi:MAG: glycosyltransferase family 2 protein [Opitutaceae bacterium]|nr:glycosyltransferase family 2 protein [Opitutaceae bacterium]
MNPLPISVVIISLNEIGHLEGCLESVRALASDIVLVDSGSTDGTVDRAKASGVRVYHRRWTGYSDQKNYANALAAHDWVLSLDVDERLTPALIAAIRAEWLRGPRADAYDLKFVNFIGNRLIRFGSWNPEYHVRLFDRTKFHWNSDEVHEGLKMNAPVTLSRLGGAIEHRTVDSVEELVIKTERYSALFAEKLLRLGRQPSWWKIWLNPVFRFWRDFVVKAGVLDGRLGFAIAWESARYTHLKYKLALPPTQREPRWSPVYLWSASVAAAGLVWLSVVLPGGWRDAIKSSAPAETMSMVSGATKGAHDDFDNHFAQPATRTVEDEEVWI